MTSTAAADLMIERGTSDQKCVLFFLRAGRPSLVMAPLFVSPFLCVASLPFN